MDVNGKILKMRERLGLTQEELEVRAGLPRNRVAKWESGTGEPHARHLAGLARALTVPVEWLVDDQAADEPPAPRPAGVVLSPEEQLLLAAVRELGYEESVRRLTQSIRPVPIRLAVREPEAPRKPGRRKQE